MTPREVHCSWTDGQMAGSRVQAGKGGAKEAKGQKILKVMMGRRSAPLRRTTTQTEADHIGHTPRSSVHTSSQPEARWQASRPFSESPQRSIRDFGGISEPKSSNYNGKKKIKLINKIVLSLRRFPVVQVIVVLKVYVKTTGLVFVSVKTLSLSSNESPRDVAEVGRTRK